MSKKKEKEKELSENEKYNQYFYIVKNDVKRKATGFPNNNPSTTQLKTLSEKILKNIGEKHNDVEFSNPKEIGCDTISTTLTDQNNLVISGNIKERRTPTTKTTETVILTGKNDKRIEGTFSSFGIDNNVADHIIKEVKKSDVYKDSNLDVTIIEKQQSDGFKDLKMLDKARDNAKSHAEMKTKKYCKETKQKIRKIGINKEACEKCHKELKKENVKIKPAKKGTKKVKNWKEEDDNVKVVKKIQRNKQVECKLSWKSSNVKFSKQAIKNNLKDNVKQSFKPGGHVGLISGIILYNTLYKKNLLKIFLVNFNSSLKNFFIFHFRCSRANKYNKK